MTQNPNIRKIDDWEKLYQEESVEKMNWFNVELDHNFKNIINEMKLKGLKVLEIGTGPGTQAIELAKLGFDVTGTDISETAVSKAAMRAANENVKVKFVYDDAKNTKLDEQFDAIFDRGCLHTFKDADLDGYVHTINKLLRPGGYLFVKTFSYKEPGETGPKRYKPDDIRNLFKDGFEICSITEDVFHGQAKPDPQALFSVIKKLD